MSVMSTGSILYSINESYDRYVEGEAMASLKDTIQEGGTGVSSGNLSDDDYNYLAIFDKSLPLIHHFPYRAVVHLPGLLTKIGGVQVTYDHFHYWAWTAEVLKNINMRTNSVERDIEDTFRLAVDFAVGRLSSVPINEQLRRENKQIRNLVSNHTQRAMSLSHRAATQLSYPLIEGLLRRLCSDFVDIDGQIKSGSAILQMNGKEKKSGRANNLGDLLYHFENRVAELETASVLESIRVEMSQFSDNKSGYQIINSWRHPHSHGGERFSGAEHVVLLNIASLLVWEEIPRKEYNEFDEERYDRMIWLW